MRRMNLAALPRSEVVAVELSDQQLIDLLERAQGIIDSARVELRRRIAARAADEGGTA